MEKKFQRKFCAAFWSHLYSISDTDLAFNYSMKNVKENITTIFYI